MGTYNPKYKVKLNQVNAKRRLDTKKNDTQQNDSQQKDTQHKDTQYNDTQHDGCACDNLQKIFATISIISLFVTIHNSIQCRYPGCRFFIVMLSVVIPYVIIPSVVMLGVVAPNTATLSLAIKKSDTQHHNK